MRYLLLLGLSFLTNTVSYAHPLPPWQKGYLDIHHINTGRGDATFIVLPDSTTCLIDAGDMSNDRPRMHSKRTAIARPDESRPPYEWIAQYIQSHTPHPTPPSKN